ncbi:hypothetical protein FYJ86_10055 [Corynebacterium urealyticum]|nr:hypothetical protein FYJ86_10055 [Corynebacterium urealyticum]
MRSFFSARNLLLANKKTTATSGGLFAGSRATNSFSEGNWLQQSADTKYCHSSVAVVRPPLQELCSTAYIPRSANPVTSGCCQWR